MWLHRTGSAAEQNGDRISSEEVGQGDEFVERYVRCVPAVLHEALEVTGDYVGMLSTKG